VLDGRRLRRVGQRFLAERTGRHFQF
jgi:hypothetical protein